MTSQQMEVDYVISIIVIQSREVVAPERLLYIEVIVVSIRT